MRMPVSSYRTILREQYEARSAGNRSYSMRAFARDLGISGPTLSLVLSRKQGLSKGVAERIARKLELDENEERRFVDLVLVEHARSADERELARIRLSRHDTAETRLDLETFRVLSDWYHFAILELTELESFESSIRWIADSLKLDESLAAEAVERLMRLNLLEESSGKLRQTRGFLATPTGTPSRSLRKFHTQLLENALHALRFQTVDERDFGSIVLPMNSADLPWAKYEIKKFRRALMTRLESAPKKDRVYCLGTQLFALSTVTSRGIES